MKFVDSVKRYAKEVNKLLTLTLQTGEIEHADAVNIQMERQIYLKAGNFTRF